MTALMTPPAGRLALPDHTQLPETDGSMVTNFEELPQSILLTDSIWPVLHKRHPDGQYAIGQNSGIYWRITDPPLDGCKAPDWFYVPGVPPRLGGQIRRSYVLWQELVAPLVILEFVSGDGSEERDQTPMKGKFWVYEQVVRAPFYGIWEVETGRLEVYELVHGSYVLMTPNERGHYPISPLGVELGIWEGQYQNRGGEWVRWWDADGNLLPIGFECAEQERQEKEQAQRQAEQERVEKIEAQQKAERLAARLRTMGIDPDAP